MVFWQTDFPLDSLLTSLLLFIYISACTVDIMKRLPELNPSIPRCKCLRQLSWVWFEARVFGPAEMTAFLIQKVFPLRSVCMHWRMKETLPSHPEFKWLIVPFSVIVFQFQTFPKLPVVSNNHIHLKMCVHSGEVNGGGWHPLITSMTNKSSYLSVYRERPHL